MESGWTEELVQSALQAILRRASRDATFRELCLNSPAEAVREAAGRELPAGFRLRFVDNARANLTVVLPDPAPRQELSDADLEAIAGGAEKTEHCGVSKICGVSKGNDPKPQL